MTAARVQLVQELADAGFEVYSEEGWQLTQVLSTTAPGLARLRDASGLTVSAEEVELAVRDPAGSVDEILSLFDAARRAGPGFYLVEQGRVEGPSEAEPTLLDLLIERSEIDMPARIVSDYSHRTITTALPFSPPRRWRETVARATVEAQAEAGAPSARRTIYEFGSPRRWRPDELLELIAESAANSAVAVAPPVGEHTVVFRGVAAGVVGHEIVGHYLEADVGGRAIRVGSRLGPATINVHETVEGDDPWVWANTDDRGRPLEDRVLVQDGEVLELIGATPVSPHWRRETFTHPALPRMRRLVLTGPDDVTAGDTGKLVIDTLRGGTLNSRTLVCTLLLGAGIWNGAPTWGGVIQLPVTELLGRLEGVGGVSNSIREICVKGGQRVRTRVDSVPLQFRKLDVRVKD